MLNIFAQSFMVATRTQAGGDGIMLPSVPKSKLQWLPEGHWWLKRN